MLSDAQARHAAEDDSSFARYTVIAILLHWSIAALIFYQFFVGFFVFVDFEGLDAEERQALYGAIQTHKAVGLTILALTVLRLGWRLVRPAPPLPSQTPGWQRAASNGSHALLYAFMIGAPLSGWAVVSSSVAYGALPTSWFGLFTVPHLPLPRTETVETAAHAAHGLAALLMAGLLLVHIAAALKHHIVDGDAILARMTPGLRPRHGALLPPLGWAGVGPAFAALLLVGGSAGAAALFAAASVERGGGASLDVDPMEAEATRWSVDHAQSRLAFSGRYFNGDFEVVWTTWSAEIAFDPERLDHSRLRVVIDAASAVSDDGDVQGNLGASDYFAVDENPRIVFEADEIVAGDGDGAYIARGALTIRDATHPVELPFAVAIDGDVATAEGGTTLDRTIWSVGPAPTDMSGIEPEIAVSLTIVARRGEAESGPPPVAPAHATAETSTAETASTERPIAETLVAEPTTEALGAAVAQWRVVDAESGLGFTGDYGLGAFSGGFSAWSAEIAFDPAALEASSIRVEVDIDSVTAGDVQIAGAIRGADYLNVVEHPTAVFISETIRRGDAENAFVADGTLTLVGVARPLRLDFTLTIDGDRAEAVGAAELDRTLFGIGPPPTDQLGIDEIVRLDIRVVAERM